MAGIPEEESFAFLIFQSVTLLGTVTKYRTSNAWGEEQAVRLGSRV